MKPAGEWRRQWVGEAAEGVAGQALGSRVQDQVPAEPTGPQSFFAILLLLTNNY